MSEVHISHMLRHGVAHAPLGARLPPWLADGYLESYLAWHEASAAVHRAYEGWNAAERADRVFAFAAYSAALDREERAALVLSKRVARVRRWLG